MRTNEVNGGMEKKESGKKVRSKIMRLLRRVAGRKHFEKINEKFLFLSSPSMVIDASLEKKSLLLPLCCYASVSKNKSSPWSSL